MELWRRLQTKIRLCFKSIFYVKDNLVQIWAMYFIWTWSKILRMTKKQLKSPFLNCDSEANFCVANLTTSDVWKVHNVTADLTSIVALND